MPTILVPISDIILDTRLQMRTKIDMEVIDEYAENVDKLPACKVVMGSGGEMWLTGGWHRYHARKKAGGDNLPCEVREGTFLDALVEACGENEGHGIPRTREDKIRAVVSLLSHEEWAGKSDRMIAGACKVSHPFVAEVRAKNSKNPDNSSSTGIDSSSNNEKDSKKREGKDGKSRPATKPPPTRCERCARAERVGQAIPKGCEMCRELRGKNPRKAKADKPDNSEMVPVDAFGTTLPKHCKAAYLDPWIQHAIDFLAVTEESLRKERLADGMAKRSKHYPFFNPKDFNDGVGFAMNYLSDLLEHLKKNRPAGVCPACGGEKCGKCHMSGMVPRELYATLKKAAK